MNFSALSDRTLIGRALRLPLRLIPSNMQAPILQGRLRGKRWITGSSDHGCWLGSYEYEKRKAFSEAVQHGDVVYDLGANVGFYSLLASVLTGPAGQVISFEPAPRNLIFLRKHLELNEVANCRVLDVAVSSSNGTSNFESGQSLSTGRLNHDAQNAMCVRTVTLDALVDSGELPPPDVIKCDIEGAECDALRGASGILARHAPTIFLATHGAEVHERCCRLLTDSGYQLTSLDGLPLAETRELLAGRQDR